MANMYYNDFQSQSQPIASGFNYIWSPYSHYSESPGLVSVSRHLSQEKKHSTAFVELKGAKLSETNESFHYEFTQQPIQFYDKYGDSEPATNSSCDINENTNSPALSGFPDRFGDVYQWTTINSETSFDRYPPSYEVTNQSQIGSNLHGYAGGYGETLASDGQNNIQTWDEIFLYDLAQWVDHIEVKDPRKIVEEIRSECEKICPSPSVSKKTRKPRKARKISPRKRGQNRQASNKYRQRKKHEKIFLSEEIKCLEGKNARLKMLIVDLTSQIAHFRGSIV